MDAAEAIHEKFVAKVGQGKLPRRTVAVQPGDVGLARETMVELFHSQCVSRQMDRLSRRLQARGEGFYTIGSSGHENNAAVAEALADRRHGLPPLPVERLPDPPRQASCPARRPCWDMLLSFAASAEDPISGGRHKVIGSKPLSIPPQTSTIASHLPKAVGAAFSIGIARMLKLEDTPLPRDSIVLASFGDASANHSTAQGAFNTAAWAAYQGTPMPIVFLCEDNGIGISTRTPRGWIEAAFRDRPALQYIRCSGLDMVDAYRGAREAAPSCPHPSASRSSCTWIACGSTAMPAPTCRPPISARRRSRRTRSAIPCSTAPPCWSSRTSCRASEILDIYNETEARLARDRRAGDRAAQAHHQRGGDGQHRAAEARARPRPTRRRRSSARPCSRATAA